MPKSTAITAAAVTAIFLCRQICCQIFLNLSIFSLPCKNIALAIIIPRSQERKRRVSGIYFPSRGFPGISLRQQGKAALPLWIALRAIIIPCLYSFGCENIRKSTQFCKYLPASKKGEVLPRLEMLIKSRGRGIRTPMNGFGDRHTAVV